MPGIQAKSKPLMNGKYPPNARDAARAVRATNQPWAESVASGFEYLSQAQDMFARALQQSPELDDFIVTEESTGRVLAALGQYEKSGIVYSGGYFGELYAGDPYGTSDPANAILSVTTDGKVQVGRAGWIDVLDPFDDSAAWIGTQADRLAVTGAVSNGGLIRLTVTAHTLATGDSVRVWEVGGVPNATGVYTVTVINANTIDLQNSVFVGTYTSGGYVNRLLHVTGAANNGSGLIRLTITAHGYESGDKVNVASVGGVPNATGQWIITVISANTFDLVGSTWGGAYTSGGICLRYAAGMLAQTFAIGESFWDYKLRAFANGDLVIHDATIVLDSANGTITLDPTDPSITVADAGGNTWATLEILTESPQAITVATNASPSVITIVGHGYVSGDTIVVAGATGNTAINGYRIVVVLTADTFTMTDMAGAAINGNGVYAGSATATRYYGGGLFQTLALGESFSNYKLRAFADGSLRIVDAEIELSDTAGTITLDPSGPAIRIVSTAGDVISLDPSDYFKFTDGAALMQLRIGTGLTGPAGSTIRGIVYDSASDVVIGTVTGSGTLPTTTGGCVICYTSSTSNALMDTEGLFVTGAAGATGFFTYNAVEFAGTQVLSTRKAGLTATIAGVGLAPALYNQVYEQTLANLGNNLKTRVDELEARLGSATGHGLFT
jgi:hypothetical protein